MIVFMKLTLNRIELLRLVNLSHPHVTEIEITENSELAIPSDIEAMWAKGQKIDAIMRLYDAKTSLENNHGRF